MFQTSPNIILIFLSAIVQVTYAATIQPDVWEPLCINVKSQIYLLIPTVHRFIEQHTSLTTMKIFKIFNELAFYMYKCLWNKFRECYYVRLLWKVNIKMTTRTFTSREYLAHMNPTLESLCTFVRMSRPTLYSTCVIQIYV